jgi:hypothetical protein
MIMIKPEDFPIETEDGTKVYILSKFDAITCREILAKYPLSAMPKLGDYAVNEATMLKLMGFVGVPIEGKEPLMLKTKTLINNHVPDGETLVKIEIAMLRYNCAFFRDGRLSTFFGMIAQQAQALLSKTLMESSGLSSGQAKPPSTN